MKQETCWYENRHLLRPDMVFRTYDGKVKLDHRVPGDGTDWVVMDWYPGNEKIPGYEKGFWACDESSIHPSELLELLED